jgi:hypothetical protein
VATQSWKSGLALKDKLLMLESQNQPDTVTQIVDRDENGLAWERTEMHVTFNWTI